MEFRNPRKSRYDAVALGEVMLRFDPGDVPMSRARTSRLFHGGGETNVAESLRSCFGLRTSVVTALVDDGIGRNIERQIRENGVDPNIIWFNTRGKGHFSTDAKGSLHNGINFTYNGKGALPSVTEYYRAHTPIMEIKAGDINWDTIFKEGVRWFHTGGIFALLSPTSHDVALEALLKAYGYGTFRSYDLNYRSKLEPDKTRAQEINQELVREVEFLVGNQDDLSDALGYDMPEIPKDAPFEDWLSAYTDLLRQVAGDYTNLRLIGTQLRRAISADRIDWGGVLYDVESDEIHCATTRQGIEIADRTGGGDSFCSGAAAALLKGLSIPEAVEWGAAHGILAQETPGDISMVTEQQVTKEIERAKKGGGVSALR